MPGAENHVGPETRTMNHLKNITIPTPHGRYSAEALLTMVFSSRDLPGDAASQINALCAGLKKLIVDVESASARLDMSSIIEKIEGLTDSKMYLADSEVPLLEATDAASGSPVADAALPEWPEDEGVPHGQPGILILLCTISWMRADEGRKKAALESLRTGKENKGKLTLKRSPRDFISHTLKAGGDIIVDWILNATKEDGILRVVDLHDAIDKGQCEGLQASLLSWGLNQEEGVVAGSKAAAKAEDDVDISKMLKSTSGRTPTEAVVHSTRETKTPAATPNAEEQERFAGSASAVMKALMAAFKSVPKEIRTKLANVMEKEEESAAAMKPLLKLMSRKEDWELGMKLIKKLSVENSSVPVANYVSVFRDSDWKPLYLNLCRGLVTKGPTPPWLADSQ